MKKKIVICADGTWNSDTETDKGFPTATNVTKLARSLASEDSEGTPQIVFYHSGVGTNFNEKISGGAFGVGLFSNVVDCYRFLILNYVPGDVLYFFGFSRGAFTVRSLAGLVRKSGILKREKQSFEGAAVTLYRDAAIAPDGPQALAFRAANSQEVAIHFIGVWDTVGALGIPGLSASFRLPGGLDWQFHDVSLSKSVEYAYHALAIHEHRDEFVPTLWNIQDAAPDSQVLEQVWFSGVHCDVGGGYLEAGLSDQALVWMLEKAGSCKDALLFDEGMVAGFKPDPLGPGHDSFGAFYKVLDLLKFKPHGALRVYAPTPQTCEDLHPSVITRYKTLGDGGKWPPSFLAELEKRAK